MRNFKPGLIRRCLGLAALLIRAAASAKTGTAHVEVVNDHVLFSSDGAQIELDSTFEILHASNNPKIKMEPRPLSPGAEPTAYDFSVPAWERETDGARTTSIFEAAHRHAVIADRIESSRRHAILHYPNHPLFRFSAEVELAQNARDLVVAFRLEPKVEGWFAVCYRGVPAYPREEVSYVWQPLVWHGRRFPAGPILSLEHMATTPAVILSTGGNSLGVAVDPSETPFRMPMFEKSRFGLLLMNPECRVQPSVVAPVLGLPESQFKAGDHFEFRFRVLLQRGDWFGMYQHIARDICGFQDYRVNATCSLNDTIENMIALGMNDLYGGWLAELRGFDYGTEIAGNTKVVSALHPLSVAIITDDEDIYWRRALPTMEYLLSREKFGFSAHADTKDHEGPSHFLRGPACEAGELAAMFSVTGQRSPVLLDEARRLYQAPPRVLNLGKSSPGDDWPNALALYRATGDGAYLDAARAKADKYITKRIKGPQENFADAQIAKGGQFWSDYFPNWKSLLDLFEETGEQRYLEAAACGAREFATVIWTSPMPPPTTVTVHKGNHVGGYASGRKSRQGESVADRDEPLVVREQRVPAWRVAQAGLAPESAVTFSMNQAVFLAPHAAYFMRLAHYLQDDFFADLGRSAVVGRYASFPGYDINGEFATVYQRPDYLLRPLGPRNYNEIYYNHLWPQIALLYDYLVAEAFYRSHGGIDFPAEAAFGYAYLQLNVHGHRPGRIHETKNVQLWMPAKLLRCSSIQINYLAAYSGTNLFLILMNQSSRSERAEIQLNPDAVPWNSGRSYRVRVWRENEVKQDATFHEGRVSTEVGPKGITVLEVEGLEVTPRVQKRFLDGTVNGLNALSHAAWETPIGMVQAMALRAGRGLTSAYVYLQATERDLTAAGLEFETAAGPRRIEDTHYPFEFSVPVDDASREFQFQIHATTVAGGRIETSRYKLPLQ